jgi:hypothetical protein
LRSTGKELCVNGFISKEGKEGGSLGKGEDCPGFWKEKEDWKA